MMIYPEFADYVIYLILFQKLIGFWSLMTTLMTNASFIEKYLIIGFVNTDVVFLSHLGKWNEL